MATKMDEFSSLLTEKEVEKQLIIGNDILSYLEDESNPIDCSDMKLFINNILPWLNDTNPRVVIKGIKIVNNVARRLKSEFQTYFSKVLTIIFVKIGDPIRLVRDECRLFLISLMLNGVMAPNIFFKYHLIVGLGNKNKYVREETIMVIQDTLTEVGPEVFNMEQVFPHLVKLLNDRSPRVRAANSVALTHLYKYYRENLRSAIEVIYLGPQNTLVELFKKFDLVAESEHFKKDETKTEKISASILQKDDEIEADSTASAVDGKAGGATDADGAFGTVDTVGAAGSNGAAVTVDGGGAADIDGATYTVRAAIDTAIATSAADIDGASYTVRAAIDTAIATSAAVTADGAGAADIDGASYTVRAAIDTAIATSAADIDGASYTVRAAIDTAIATSAADIDGASYTVRAAIDTAIATSAADIDGASYTVRATNDTAIATSAADIDGASYTVRAAIDTAIATSAADIDGASYTVRAAIDTAIATSAADIDGASYTVRAANDTAIATSAADIDGASYTVRAAIATSAADIDGASYTVRAAIDTAIATSAAVTADADGASYTVDVAGAVNTDGTVDAAGVAGMTDADGVTGTADADGLAGSLDAVDSAGALVTTGADDETDMSSTEPSLKGTSYTPEESIYYSDYMTIGKEKIVTEPGMDKLVLEHDDALLLLELAIEEVSEKLKNFEQLITHTELLYKTEDHHDDLSALIYGLNNVECLLEDWGYDF